jgi:hypothetical protein
MVCGSPPPIAPTGTGARNCRSARSGRPPVRGLLDGAGEFVGEFRRDVGGCGSRSARPAASVLVTSSNYRTTLAGLRIMRAASRLSYRGEDRGPRTVTVRAHDGYLASRGCRRSAVAPQPAASRVPVAGVLNPGVGKTTLIPLLHDAAPPSQISPASRRRMLPGLLTRRERVGRALSGGVRTDRCRLCAACRW